MSKKVICVQDLSCFGKCSLTITMPVLACAGIEVVPLPTALLSTHTGGLGHPYIHDLSREIKAIRAHWKTLSLPIHVLYCGYVSDLAQLAQIQALIKQYPHAYRFVDPVMGDHGRLYASLPKDLPHAMAVPKRGLHYTEYDRGLCFASRAISSRTIQRRADQKPFTRTGSPD